MKKLKKVLVIKNIRVYLHPQILKGKRELSSAGSEHLPYKQGVTGSNPVVPTKEKRVTLQKVTLFSISFVIYYHYIILLSATAMADLSSSNFKWAIFVKTDMGTCPRLFTF